eukprot:gene3728-6616_t
MTLTNSRFVKKPTNHILSTLKSLTNQLEAIEPIKTDMSKNLEEGEATDWRITIEATYKKYKPNFQLLDVLLVILSFVATISLAILINIYVFGHIFHVYFSAFEVGCWLSSLVILAFSFSRSKKKDDHHFKKVIGFIGIWFSMLVSFSQHQPAGLNPHLTQNFLSFVLFFISGFYLKSVILLTLSSFSLHWFLLISGWASIACSIFGLQINKENEHFLVCLFTVIIGLVLQMSKIKHFNTFRWSFVGFNYLWMYIHLFVLSQDVNSTNYWKYNLITVICIVVGILIGSLSKKLKFLRDLSIIFFIVFLIQKGTEISWRQEEFLFFLLSISIVLIISILYFKQMKKKEG